MTFDGTVESVHPFVDEFRQGNRGQWFRIGARFRQSADHEDLDALPVEEQAAIVCAIFASDAEDALFTADAAGVVGWAAVDVASSVERGAQPDDGLSDVESWAEAEARIRNGEVAK